MRFASIVFALVAACSSGGDAPAVGPSSLPLLAAGTHIGVVYSSPSAAAETTLDAAFAETIAAGVDSYELSIAWTDIETSPGVIDTGYLSSLLTTVQSTGLVPYLVLKTIDTNNLNLPADLIGLDFDDPVLLTRFASLLDAVVPLLVQRGGFYLSVGNEVDSWLGANQAQIGRYANFVAAARAHAHSLEPRLAVGATLTFGALTELPAAVAALRPASDALAFTYYPLNGDFSVRDPFEVTADIEAMLAATAPRPLLLQEVGYPAGWEPNPTNNSSPEKQRQFVANVFASIAANPRIRFASFLHLADWGDADLDLFESYYGLSNPEFREYLGTLGMRAYADGAPKPAYAEFLAQLAAG